MPQRNTRDRRRELSKFLVTCSFGFREKFWSKFKHLAVRPRQANCDMIKYSILM
ncbi:hypothetical protein SETIT_3G252800v2 [Setaria italica]|uniref:Uncharacterized protein n=2 Tax=Setaria TaxID=4554 RepID=K3ZBS4_SETIT|nr:hypothetical protein SETIT_3G252800v2 [Setaria italica]TKW27462.1 hypothetical protein SEVIR_3G258800v2 [Setaria viridis]